MRFSHSLLLKKIIFLSITFIAAAFLALTFSAFTMEASVQVKQCIGGVCQLTSCDPENEVPSCVDSCDSNSDCDSDGGGSISCGSNETKHCTTADGGSCWCEPDNEPEPTYNRLTVRKSGTGSGTVSGSGISCGSTCTGDYSQNTTAALTASPSSNSRFSGWSIGAYQYCTSSDKNGCNSYAWTCGTISSCRVVMSSSRTVTATFTRHTLFASLSPSSSTGEVTHTVNFTASRTGGTASGTVTYSPSCGSGGTLLNWSGTSDRYFTCRYTTVGSRTAMVSVRQQGITSRPTASVNVTTPPPPPADVTISAVDTSLAYMESTDVRWQPSNASSCTATGAWSGPKASSSIVHTESTGSLAGPASYTYSIQCSGTGGSSPVESVTISVAAQDPIGAITFEADPMWIRKGGDSDLVWTAPNADSCTLTGPGVSVTVAGDTGSYSVTNIQGVTTFTLDCENSRGPAPSQTATVYVLPTYEEI